MEWTPGKQKLCFWKKKILSSHCLLEFPKTFSFFFPPTIVTFYLFLFLSRDYMLPFVLLTLACCLKTLPHPCLSLQSSIFSFYHKSLSCDVNTYSTFYIKNTLDLMSHFCNYCGFLPQLVCNCYISISVFHLTTHFDQQTFCSL